MTNKYKMYVEAELLLLIQHKQGSNYEENQSPPHCPLRPINLPYKSEMKKMASLQFIREEKIKLIIDT
jgi:hypothetical protein